MHIILTLNAHVQPAIRFAQSDTANFFSVAVSIYTNLKSYGIAGDLYTYQLKFWTKKTGKLASILYSLYSCIISLLCRKRCHQRKESNVLVL